jgi:hypothetical protein
VRLSPLGTASNIGLFYQPQILVIVEQLVECRLAGETEVLGEHPPPMILCPLQIPHYLIRAWTRAAAVGSRRLTAWAIARPDVALSHVFVLYTGNWDLEGNLFCWLLSNHGFTPVTNTIGFLSYLFHLKTKKGTFLKMWYWTTWRDTTLTNKSETQISKTHEPTYFSAVFISDLPLWSHIKDTNVLLDVSHSTERGIVFLTINSIFSIVKLYLQKQDRINVIYSIKYPFLVRGTILKI